MFAMCANKMLNCFAAHPRDALIEFDAGPHKYTCMGEANYNSVTGWNHTHFPAFDADAIIAKMNLTNPKSKYYGQTPEQIKAGWDKGRDEAAEAGTAMHAAIEAFWIGGAPLEPPSGEGRTQGAEAEPSLPIEAHPSSRDRGAGACGAEGVSPHFGAFVADNPQLKPYRTEWMIFDEDVRLAGSIDFVSENEDGTLTIYDWKRCKEIKKANGFGGYALTECIAHLPDTNYWHYALQLNTYKAILERKYEKTVKHMFLVGLHPHLSKYQIYTVPNLAKEMADLFALRAAQQQAEQQQQQAVS